MREIKFRAWDKNNKVMSFVCGITAHGEDGSIFGVSAGNPQTKAMKQYPETIKNGNWICAFNDYQSGEKWNDSLVLMQFTGLKDSKGKEIYEGDIVRILVGKNKKARDIVVEWKGGGFKPRTLNKGHWEVIGNIYDKLND